jgi:hypothetical protein
VLFNFKIDWVLVGRRSRTLSEVDIVGYANSYWEFKSVFDRERPVSSESNNNCLFYDRSCRRQGYRLLDDGTVSSINVQPMGTKKRKRNETLWKIRYLKMENVSFEDRLVDPIHLIPVYSSEIPTTTRFENQVATRKSNEVSVLVTVDTPTYRLLAASQLPMDQSSRLAVLEIGSSTGGTSDILWNQIQKHPCGGRWMGIDTSSEMVSVVQSKLFKRYPHLKDAGLDHSLLWAECCHADPLLGPDATSVLVRKFLGCKSSVTDVVVFIDIGGDREEGAVLRMIDWVLRTFQKDFSEPSDPFEFQLHRIVVKSEAIHETFSNIEDAQEPLSILENGDSWFRSRLGIALRSSFPKHPLQAAKRFVPKSHSIGGVDSKIICRYYNYHKAGCAKKIDNMCMYDHDHCHMCLGVGHIALVCPLIFDVSPAPADD